VSALESELGSVSVSDSESALGSAMLQDEEPCSMVVPDVPFHWLELAPHGMA